MKTMHLFAGGGGGMYADLILGHETIAAVEWDNDCCRKLTEQVKDGWFPDCRIHHQNVITFSGKQYAGQVGAVAAGIPCPTFSTSGLKAGLEDPRGQLYKEAIRIYREVGAYYLFLENVTGILTAQDRFAFSKITADLVKVGLDMRWVCLPASAVGAHHKRMRWWCLAYPHGLREPQQERSEQDQWGWVGNKGENVAYTKRVQREQHRLDAGMGGSGELGQDGNAGVSPWDIEPNLGRVVDGVAPGSQLSKEIKSSLKMLGNSQYPRQAAYAWIMLGGPVAKGILL